MPTEQQILDQLNAESGPSSPFNSTPDPMVEEWKKQRAAAVMAAPQAAPDAAAQGVTLSKSNGLPWDTNARNLSTEHTASQAAVSQLLMKGNPFLTQYVSQPNGDAYGAISHDDMPALNNVSSALWPIAHNNGPATSPSLATLAFQANNNPYQIRPTTAPSAAPAPAPVKDKSYLWASALSGMQSFGSTASRILDDAMKNPLLPLANTDEELAAMYKNDPVGLMDARAAPNQIFARRAQEYAQASKDTMASVDPDDDASKLQYNTLDPSKAAYLSPKRLTGDALQMLPVGAALVASAYLTKGASAEAESTALAGGATAEEAKAIGTQAAMQLSSRVGAGTNAALFGAQNQQETEDKVESTPFSELETYPAYQKLIKQGYAPESARLFLAGQASNQAGLGGALAGAVGGKIGGAVLGKVIGEGGALIPRIAKAALTEGAQNAEQMALSQGSQNVAMSGVNPNQDLGENVGESAVQGFTLGGLMGGATGGLMARAGADHNAASFALKQGDALDKVMATAADTKTQARSPDAMENFVGLHTKDTIGENLFIPAEAVAKYAQSADFDYHHDAFWGQYADDIDHGLVSGGDVVVPTDKAVAHLAGTDQWAALKDDVRTTAGGMSPAEAKSIQDNYAGHMGQYGEQMADQMVADKKAAAPAQAIYQSVRDKLMDAGLTPDAAHANAELIAARYSTRAERQGVALTGNEADKIEFRANQPEALKGITPRTPTESVSDDLKSVIKTMRSGKGERSTEAQQGPNLLQFIQRRGGIEDRGGDIKAMGAGAIKGIAKKGQVKLIKPFDDSAQLIGNKREGLGNSPDDTALAAWELGYFPEHSERPTQNDLLDAVGEGIAGRHRYADINSTVNASDHHIARAHELEQILDQHGVDMSSASDKDIRAALDQHQAKVIDHHVAYSGSLFDEPEQPAKTMTDAQRSEIEAQQKQSMARRGGQTGLGDQDGGLFSSERDQNRLFQDEKGGPRGEISFANGRAIIDLFRSRDMSTVIHETGHLWLEELREDAEHANATDQNKSDWKAVQDWFAKEGHSIGEDGAIPVDAHEMWARGWERFAMEGKSPSAALRRVFETFRSWLVNVYKSVSSLNTPITPEVRNVMERLIATDSEIKEAQTTQHIKAAWSDAASAGMSQREYEAYAKAVQGAHDRAHDELLEKTMRTVRAAKTAEWKGQEADVRGEVADRMSQVPAFRAEHLIATGKDLTDPEAKPVNARLDPKWLKRQYGDDVLKELPQKVPPLWSDKAELHPDDIAQRSGFDNGDEMVKALIGLEDQRKTMRANGDTRTVRKAMTDDAVAREMNSRHGDPLNDGSIEQEALAAIHNDAHGEVMATELRQLGKKTGQQATPYALAKEWAHETIAKGAVNDVLGGQAVQRYTRSAAAAGKDFEAALIKGDHEGAFAAKQKQMLNNALIREASQTKDLIDKAVRKMGKLAKAKTIAGIEQSYLDQIHGLLEQVDMRQRSQASLDRQQTFADWAKAQTESGHDIVVPDEFAASLGQTNWSRLPVEKLLGLSDTIKQIEHLGRNAQKLYNGQVAEAFQQVVDEAVAQAADLKQIKQDTMRNPGTSGKDPLSRVNSKWLGLKSSGRSLDSSLLKIEQMMDWLDHKVANGAFNRTVFKPIAEGQFKKQDLMLSVAKKFRDLSDAVPKEVKADWGNRYTIPELIDSKTGEASHMRKSDIIMMALNWGTESNRDKLVRGEREAGWTPEDVKTVLDRHMSTPDWDFVVGTWHIFEGLRPDLEALEKRVNGVAPEWIKPSPVETPHGTFEGGYFPVMYDPLRGDIPKGGSDDMFGPQYVRATTNKGHTIERTGYAAPMWLSMDAIPRHLDQVIHDIAYREPIMQAVKFLNDKRIKRAIDGALGPEYTGQLNPWLKNIAQGATYDNRGLKWYDDWARKIRINSTIMGIGFRATTMLKHGLTASANSLGEVGPRWMGSAVKAFTLDPAGTRDFIFERSGEMRHRMNSMDRDIHDVMAKSLDQKGLLDPIKRLGFSGVAMMDYASALPTWLGAYNKAMHEGSSEEEAAYIGDKSVRNAHGAGEAKDLAAIQRGTEVQKLFTMFYGFFNHMYNRQRDIGRDAMNIKSTGDFAHVLARSWFYFVAPAIIEGMISGTEKKDDESWPEWAGLEIGSSLFSGIPLVRDMARSIMRDGLTGKALQDGALKTPAADFITKGGQPFVDAAKTIKGDNAPNATKHAIDSVGYLSGLPLGQASNSGQFLWDVMDSNQSPKDAMDWYRGLTSGKSDPPRSH